MSNVSEWTTAAAGNQDSPPNGFPEGQTPSSLNDASREVMAAVARWYRDNQGSLTSTGINSDYAITSNSAYSALSDLPPIVFIANHTNTGAATLNVDGLGAKPIHSSGADVVAGQIVADVVIGAVYNATDDVYDLLGASNNDASKLTQGILPDARLSSNVVLESDDPATLTSVSIGSGQTISDSGNVFNESTTFTHPSTSGSPTVGLASTNPQFQFHDTGAGSDRGIFNSGILADGDFRMRALDDSFGQIGTALRITWDATQITNIFLNSNITDVQTGTLRYGGLEVGFRGAPSRNISSSTTSAASDNGHRVRMTGGSGQTFTLDSDPPDDAVIFLLNTSGNDWTIAASGTLRWSQTGGAGSRTLADDGMATATHIGSGNWYIEGALS